MKKKSILVHVLAALAALGTATPPFPAAAQTNQWQGANSDWSDGTNWSLGTVPADGEDVEVTDGLGGVTTVEFFGVGTPTYNSLLIDGVTVSHSDSATMATDALVVGGSGFATLSLGNDAVLNVTNNAVFGSASSSAGYAGQNDSSAVAIGGDLILGELASSYADYSLESGTLDVTGQTIVGAGGEAYFTQNGGTHTTGGLVLGRDDGAYGEYFFNGGVLNDTAIVGDAGVGVFNNNGATHNVTGDLILGNQATGDGTYELTAGTLTSSTTFVGGEGTGDFKHHDGDHTADFVYVGGGVPFGGSGTYTIDDGTLTVNNDLGIGTDGFGFNGEGHFVQNGGSVLVGGGFYMDGGDGTPQATYTLNDGTLVSGSFGSMSNDSVFDHDGGTHTNNSLFIIGNSGGSDYDTIYNITGATAEANFNDLWVGGFGRGILNQSGGTVNVTGELRIGDGPNIDPTRRFGEYNLSAGDLIASNNVIVGAGNNFNAGEPGGLGTFNQTGGMATIGGDLILGQGGTIGGGTGTFVQDAGDVEVTGGTFVGGGGDFGGTGIYTMNAGTLTTDALVVAQTNAIGTFNHNDGTVTVTGFLTVGEGAASDGKYNLSGGTLTAGNTIVGGALLAEPSGATGVIHQTGGTFDTGFLNVGGGGFALKGTGTYDMDGGDLIVADSLNLGNDVGGTGTFNQNDGTVHVNSAGFGAFINNGSYNLGAGSLTIVNNLDIGGLAGVAGTFSQSGGTADIGKQVTLGGVADGDGTFQMSGGTATIGSMIVGKEGTGALALSGTAELKATNDPGNLFTLSVGKNSGGSGTVTIGDSAKLEATGRFTVGEIGTGSVTQGGSSEVKVSGLRLGNASTATGTYMLNGGTLTVLSGAGVEGGSRIGLAEGTGIFTQNGGTHTTPFMEIGGASFGQGGDGTGTYNLNGGILSVAGGITVRQAGNSGAGTLNVAGGTLTATTIFNNDTLNYSGGSITANVNNQAASSFNVSGGAPLTLTGTLNNGGPPANAGTLNVAVNTPFTITGNLNQLTGGLIDAASTITVGGDYSNVGFGSGNSFDRHAGVTLTNGAQIIGSNASQTITATGNPAQLTNNGPNEFTLDMGIVRGNGGSVTLNYQVKNDGTGASIRGAVQTTANGANLTDGRLTGAGVSEGVFGPIAAGGNGGNLSVTLTGSSGGALTGQKVAIYSNYDNVATQILNLTGEVTILANGNATPSPGPVNLGNFRVGGTLPSQNFDVENTVSGSLAERLGIASPIGTTGNFGAASNLGGGFIAPGATESNAVTASVVGGAAGVNNGSMTIQYTTNGQSINGSFGTIDANQQTIELTATGYNAAAGSASPDPIVIANQRVGGSLTQALTIENTAPVSAFTEKLNASFGANGGQATNNGGNVSLLAAGAQNNSNMLVGVDTSSAGAKVGTVTVDFATDGTGTSGLSAAAVGSKTIDVSGNVYNAAVGSAAPAGPIDLGNVRVGGVLAQAFTVSNVAPAGSFSEDLNASFGSNTGHASNNGGSISQLLAGSNDGAAMSASLSTGSSGAKTGTVTINYETTGTVNGASNTLGVAGAGSQTITLNGNVYQAASGQIQTGPLNFNVQVGQVVAQDLVIRNIATGAAGYVEDLNASFGASGDARITGTGSLVGILAGMDSTGANGTMTVNVDTSAVGSINSTITVLYETAGKVAGVSNNLGTASAGSENYSVVGTIQANVIDLAKPVINGIANPGAVTVDFGNVRINTASSQTLTVLNQATGNDQANLNASIASNGAPVSASGSFSGLMPGDTFPTSGTGTALQVGIDTSAAGMQNGSATVSLVSDITSFGNCAPNCTLNLPNQTVNVSAKVFQVAQPDVPANVNLGNFRLGSAPSQAITIGNTDISPAGFQEGLDAVVGGTSGKATATGGPIDNLAAGGTSNAITVGIDNGTATAGVNNGTVTLNLASNGTGTSGLSTFALNDAVINVSATGWNMANGQATPSPVNLGNFRVGQAGGAAPQSQDIAVSNTVAGPFTEGLGIGSASIDNAAFALTNNLGSGLIAAGGSNATALNVARTGGVAGVNSGTLSIQYTTDGTGTSGLAAINANSQNITVNATGYLVAQPNVPVSVNLGNVRLGSASQAISIANTDVAGSFQEGLNASTGAFGGQGTATGGPITNLAPGGSSNVISVGLVGIVAGNGNAGTVEIKLASNGTASGLADFDLPSQTVNVSATGYRLANPQLNNSPITLAARVGDAVSANTGVSITNSSPDIYTEGLKVQVTGASGNVQHNNGSIANLAAQGTDSSSILVGLDSSAAAGSTSSQVDLKFVSTGAGTTGAPDMDIGTGTVTVNSKVYAAAVAQLDTPLIDFGVVRKGTVVGPQSVTVTNAASAEALNDTMKASMGTASSSAFSAGGSVSGLGAGQSNAGGTLTVGLSTTSAGQFNGSVDVSFVSRNPDMADLDLDSGQVTLMAQVNEIANPVFGKTGGAGSFGCVGLVCTLDFGDVLVGGGSIAGILQLINDVSGPADDLIGSFDLAGLGAFDDTGFGPVGLAPGETLAGLTLGFDASNVGLFTGSFVFSGFSHNDFQTDLALAGITVNLRANVVQQGTVPEPGTIWLILLAAGLAIGVRRRKALPLH